ncbi:MAG: RidA family protein [Armatimonadetes bacterium]|nr:RidA family protein [Armatimonadota bacterium]
MERHTHNTSRAPAAIGPYSQAVFAEGKFLFVSGQLGMHPDGEMAGDTIEEQTRQALSNLLAILDSAGMSTANLVKTTIYLKDMDDFAAVNEIYGGMIGSEPPARAAVQVARLPKDALIEIDGIAVTGA